MLKKIAIAAALAGSLGLTAVTSGLAAPPSNAPSATIPKQPGVGTLNVFGPDLSMVKAMQVINPDPSTCSATLKVCVQNTGNKPAGPTTLNVTVVDYHNAQQFTTNVGVGCLAAKSMQWVEVPINVGHPVEYAVAKFTCDSLQNVNETSEGNNVYTKVIF